MSYVKKLISLLEKEEKKYPALREVKITYSDGTVINTNMAATVTDDEIKEYYKIGSSVNIGNGEKDKMAKIKKVEIIK